MYNFFKRYNKLSYGFQLLLLLGVPTLLALIIYKNNPLVSNANLGPLIIIAMWWLIVFGWLNFYEQKEEIKKLVIKISQLPPDEREKLIKEADIHINEDTTEEILERDIYPKAGQLIESVDHASRYKTVL